MTQLLHIHPTHPQPRLIQQAVAALQHGGVIVYPTDSCYALGCPLDVKEAQDRIRLLRGVDDKHHFTLVCRDLSAISLYANIDNSVFRLLKALTPGPYTFILKASREVPRRIMHPRRKTIGLRVPEHPVVAALLDALGTPILSSTLILPGDEHPLADTEEIMERLNKRVDIVIDGGYGGIEPTTVVDLTAAEPVVVRQGRGEISAFISMQ